MKCLFVFTHGEGKTERNRHNVSFEDATLCKEPLVLWPVGDGVVLPVPAPPTSAGWLQVGCTEAKNQPGNHEKLMFNP